MQEGRQAKDEIRGWGAKGQTHFYGGQTGQQGRDKGMGAEGQTESQRQVSVGQTGQGRDKGRRVEGQTDRQTDRDGHPGGQAGQQGLDKRRARGGGVGVMRLLQYKALKDMRTMTTGLEQS